MSNFKLKIEFEGKKLVEKKGENISDFDNIMDGLREKFDGHKRKKNG